MVKRYTLDDKIKLVSLVYSNREYSWNDIANIMNRSYWSVYSKFKELYNNNEVNIIRLKGEGSMKGRERTAKFYFDNEKEVMLELGLVPTPGSGSGWVHKEDGYNDHVLCQLKSTDKESYRIKQLDLEKLEYNASVANKIPMFIVQFLNDNTRYALMAIEDIPHIAEYIKCGEATKPLEVNLEPEEKVVKNKKPIIKADAGAAKRYKKQQQKKWEEMKWKK